MSDALDALRRAQRAQQEHDERVPVQLQLEEDEEPRCGDPRPDPRTHPEFWTE